MSKYNSHNYKETFIVEGNFYNIRYDTENIVKCRNLLRIKKRNCIDKIEHTFVMMNPGSSYCTCANIPEYSIKDIEENGIPLKLKIATPDNVQFYIMEIMDQMNWDTINIINLSDIREPSSKQFKNKVSNLRKKFKDSADIHSVFYENRNDLNNLINGSNYVICSWGTGPLRGLDKKAVEFFNSKDIEILGKRKGGKRSNKYYYLKPIYSHSIVSDLVSIIKNKISVSKN